MADAGSPLSEPRPLLAFAPAKEGPIPQSSTKPSFRPPVRGPSAARQGERLAPQFRTLSGALKQERAQLADSTAAADPELVAVLDLAGTVDAFLSAAARIDGLELLADLLEDSVEADDDFFYETEGDPSDDDVPQSLYMLMTNAQAVEELVRLFELWQQNQSVKFAQGLAPLKQVFGLLRSIRRWSPEDRVRETGILDQWAEDVEVAGTQGTRRVEIELWHRRDAEIRRIAEDEVTAIVRSLGGVIVASAQLPHIVYHGILADIPISCVQQVLDEGPSAIELLTTERVMLVSPSKPMNFPASEPVASPARQLGRTPDTNRPRIALLDGVPMENHAALEGRLIVDDPDTHSAKYELTQRNHGTAMASLIAHGDLSAPGVALPQQIYVRPVFEPHQIYQRVEVVQQDRLLVDLIHRAFHGIFEGDGSKGPAAPSIRIVCFALGDPARAFIRRLSPLARLLDWLAEKYNIVIVVSGGNVVARPEIELAAMADQEELQSAALKSLHDQALNRRLLAPAEAVNVLTVGATHADIQDRDLPDTVLDVVPDGLPAPYSPVGFGYRRSVKPEILMPGGRQVYRAPPPHQTGPAQLEILHSSPVGPGLGVATPGLAGETDAIGYTCGTSNATALAARTLSQVFDVLEGLKDEDDLHPFPDAQYHPVLAKTLLVHAAGWHEDLLRLKELLGLSGQGVRRELTRMLGYGTVRGQRATSATSTRVMLLGAGSIKQGKRHTFRFPLPSELSASTEWRRLTITMGWLSPINVHSQKYRKARLIFTPSKKDLGVSLVEADHNAARNGTVQHQVLEGKAATTYASGAELVIDVDCRSDGGKLENPVRYGLAASLEVGPTVRSDIHDQVRSRLSEQARERALVATSQA
ncbi:MAG: S8 family peptidase [Acidimicrobiaceae bacterium]|nr:S8 family peptidase [Acidimicrobiaceae bacterium]MCY4295054.1 S8 family peptidase [Acidimicrobiaceae bacterium]